MKKSENSKILPYTKKQIASVILHPETCNIRGYQVYKKLDEDNWIEDYGDHFLMKFYFTEVSEDRIVMERYPFAQSSVHEGCGQWSGGAEYQGKGYQRGFRTKNHKGHREP